MYPPPVAALRAADSTLAPFARMVMPRWHALSQRGAPWSSADGCHGAAGGPKLGLRNTVRFNAKLWGHKAIPTKIIQAKLLLNSREILPQ